MMKPLMTKKIETPPDPRLVVESESFSKEYEGNRWAKWQIKTITAAIARRYWIPMNSFFNLDAPSGTRWSIQPVRMP